MTALTLASASPRRRELLATIVADFEVEVADVDESPLGHEHPDELVRRLAAAKAMAVHRPGGVTIGSDTVVVLDTIAGPLIQGKPLDHADAVRMLRLQRGRAVRVISAVAVASTTGIAVAQRISTLRMAHPDDAAVAAYVTSGEADDKAGALSVQGGASGFVSAVDGCWTNVLGLPLCATRRLLTAAGVDVHGTCVHRDGSRCPAEEDEADGAAVDPR